LKAEGRLVWASYLGGTEDDYDYAAGIVIGREVYIKALLHLSISLLLMHCKHKMLLLHPKCECQWYERLALSYARKWCLWFDVLFECEEVDSEKHYFEMKDAAAGMYILQAGTQVFRLQVQVP
jgi:hypothetical protein